MKQSQNRVTMTSSEKHALVQFGIEFLPYSFNTEKHQLTVRVGQSLYTVPMLTENELHSLVGIAEATEW